MNNGGTEINITGGKLIGGTESGGNAIYHPQLGTLNISGGELSGYDGIQFKSGSLKLLGGTITATGAKVTPVANDNGAVGTGAALSLITSSAYIGSMDVVIAGTAKLEATGTGASAVYEGIHETGDTSSASELKKFAVSSGTLISSGDALSFTSEGIEEVITITGGIYSSDPTEYVAEGYEVVPVGDMWQVQKTQPVGPVTPVIEPIAPVLPDVSDDVKEEVKPVVGATETDTAEAAAKLDGITEDMLEIDKDEIVAVKADTVVKVVENIATLENVTSADVLPLPVFTAKVESKKTVMISFSLAGADLKAAKPEDVKVLKVLGADSGRLFKYASDITADMDEKFTIQKVDGTIFKGAIEGSETYILSIFIKDGGAFDLDEADGSVADPVAILATKTVEPHHSSSSGCNAGFAGLLLLAAVPFIYRRKR
ncbi:Synerg-CTERM sorting domain-containing protein [Cloacibacillus porcorum]|uniref:Synerg-CTERM sorting domain-containing protein n=1 Tax=Cloacibacillus porcorum TaxID=1197717 RepID=UPI003F04D59D